MTINETTQVIGAPINYILCRKVQCGRNHYHQVSLFVWVLFFVPLWFIFPSFRIHLHPVMSIVQPWSKTLSLFFTQSLQFKQKQNCWFLMVCFTTQSFSIQVYMQLTHLKFSTCTWTSSVTRVTWRYSQSLRLHPNSGDSHLQVFGCRLLSLTEGKLVIHWKRK